MSVLSLITGPWDQRSFILLALMFCGDELWISKFFSGPRNGGREKCKTPKGGCEGRAAISNSNLGEPAGPRCL